LSCCPQDKAFIMHPNQPRSTAKQVLLATAIALHVSAAGACPNAFISTQNVNNAVQIVDLTSMTVVGSITGIGAEPGRMVATADRSRIYLSSYIAQSFGNPARGMVYLIDTASRRVVNTASVGNRQNRTIALSPDESRVYTFKQTGSAAVGDAAIGVAVLNADTLAELALAPLPTTECLQTAKEVIVHPDGRIFVSGCSDFIRMIDPITLNVSTLAPHPAGTVGRMLGFSPNGAELYVPVGSADVGGNAGLVAIDIATGTSANFYYDLQSSSGSIFPNGSQALRMLTVQRPDDAANDPTVFFTYASAAGNSPVVHARSSDLSPAVGAPLRRILSRHNIGASSVMGASANASQGIGTRLGGMQKIYFSPPGIAPIAAVGNGLSLPGVSNLSDIIVDDGFFCSGFE
jgi:DNA-binding beta-propeller fold protein YncE